MAYTATDLENIETAIRKLITGTRVVSYSGFGRTINYTPADLPMLQKMRDTIASELGLSSGTFCHRTYAKQGGRGA